MFLFVDNTNYSRILVKSIIGSSTMLEIRRTVIRNRSVVCACLLLGLIPAAMIRILFLYRNPEFSSDGQVPATMFAVDNRQTSAARDTNEGPLCDSSKGEWVPVAAPPLYTNQTCRLIQDTQNCMRNGRPDSNYLHWMWRPYGCDVVRSDARAFLQSMKGKRLAFVGDSIARNQMQSLLCILAQVEEPTNTFHREDDKINHWLFPSYSFVLTIYWSPYLVKQSSLHISSTDTTITQLDLDVLDPWVMSMAGTDVIVISSGQWYFKAGAYREGGKVISCHLCPGSGFEQGSYFKSYGTALHTVLKELLTLQGFHGITILRTFAPDHFENGLWDTGGTCSRTEPSRVTVTEMNRLMHDIEHTEYLRIVEEVRAPDADRVRLLDITDLAQLRPDGHPGPYRNLNPYSKDAKEMFQIDCLHWCLPGPIDTWNELLMETLQHMKL